MTKHHAPAEPTTPLDRFKATYTPLYRMLLILGLLAALASLAGLSNLRTILGYVQDDPFYAISGLMTALIVPALMISSLILLWHKHPVGIKLRLGGYAVSIFASVIGFFTSRTTLEKVTREVIESTTKSAQNISPELAASITEVSFFGALYVSIGASILFAWLWWKAWKKQVRSDKKMQKDT